MSFPRYQEYKDSGDAAIGQIPSHWRVARIGDVANVVNGYPFDSALFHDDGAYPLIRIRDLGVSETATRYSGDFVETAAVTSSDVLIGMDGDFNVGRWLGTGAALLNQRMCCIRTPSPELTKLLEYALPQPLRVINDLTYATTVKHLSSSQIEKIRVALALDRDELRAIVRFLDRETAKIDALVAEQEKLIALLQEKRQAVISHAVTKGLDPNVPMKDSGVEWLGEVPGHWEVAAVNYRYEVLLGKMLDEKRITGRHLAPYLRNVDVQWDCINTEDLPQMDFSGDDIVRYGLTAGDLLVCEGGDVGRSAIWVGELEECYYQKALHRLRPRQPAHDASRFQFYVLNMASTLGIFTGGEGKATIAHLTAEALRRYRFAYPPQDEQTRIVKFLDEKTTKLDTLTAEARTAITLLQERRTALISAAVTGQIDVRGLLGSANAPASVTSGAHAAVV